MSYALIKKAVVLATMLCWVAFWSGIGMAAEQNAKMVQLLFVQSAKEVSFDNGQLTLKGISPATGVLF